METDNSLGNDAFLSKIDSLRATNVGSMIPLPQVIVVGDQSSGKSSALESLTGFAFPRAATLCTRYATQISCTRASEKSIAVSIIPRPDASGDLKSRLQAFHHQFDEMDDARLAQIFHEANTVMGIRMGGNIYDNNASAFSEDILKIDISGPDQAHLTLIDVPGIFRIPTPGLTTDGDIRLVRNMVKRYMESSRTIILAVIPCNVDIANQEILKLAAEADPEGVRTMGVLTKPDLATERATQNAVLELIDYQRNVLKLGYCILKNRSADDYTSTVSERLAEERSFFQSPPWSNCSNSAALGTDALRTRLRSLLLDISKRELPHVRAELDARHYACTEQLTALGPPRTDEAAQRQYLVHIAARVQDVTKSALNGYYAGDSGLFERRPELRLVTKLVHLNEAFSDEFWKKGHAQHFRDKWTADGEAMLRKNDLAANDSEESAPKTSVPVADNESVNSGDANESDSGSSESNTRKLDSVIEAIDMVHAGVYEELAGVISPLYKCPKPLRGPLTGLIREAYQSSRGPELGTFNGTILASIFGNVSRKWEPLVLSHSSKAIAIVHDYIRKLLDEFCVDETVRRQLWDVLLRDELHDRYRAIMNHARFLLRIERDGLPMTFNHYFNSTLQKKRQARVVAEMKKYTQSVSLRSSRGDTVESEAKYVPVSMIERLSEDMGNGEHVCEDILDTVESYYKVARKRFVDTVCQHIVYHMLLVGPDSPLKILSPGRILELSSSQLAAIAGEDTMTRKRRQALQRQLESLEEAAKVLRS